MFKNEVLSVAGGPGSYLGWLLHFRPSIGARGLVSAGWSMQTWQGDGDDKDCTAARDLAKEAVLQ